MSLLAGEMLNLDLPREDKRLLVIAETDGCTVDCIATQATVIGRARAEGKHRFIHAFPSVDNGPSNAICRTAGFSLQGEADFEYPPGHFMRCKAWRVELLRSS